MRKHLFAVLALALIVASAGPAQAVGTSQIRMTNQTPDAWVWVTYYETLPLGPKIRFYYCLYPKEHTNRAIHDTVDKVRVEVMMVKYCGGKIHLDETLSTDGGPSSSKGLVIRAFVVHGSGGRYTFAYDASE